MLKSLRKAFNSYNFKTFITVVERASRDYLKLATPVQQAALHNILANVEALKKSLDN